MTGPKIVTLDIETSPALADVWRLWDQNVSLNQLHEVSRVICFAAKWYGEPKVEFYSEHHHGHEEMVSQAYRIMDEADAMIHYNGKKFDTKHLNREIALQIGAPPAPFKQIDLYNVVKAKFAFMSNKLEHVARQFGLGGKAQTGGHELWTRCLLGETKAWNQMKKYNIQDVVLTEKLYDKLLPWIDGHPNWNIFSEDGDLCPNCGGDDLQSRGYSTTNIGKYRRYRCLGCGRWSQGKTSEFLSNIRPVAGY
jgi:RNase_H superfamily